MKFNIFCNFDGTITVDDATNTILEAFALPEYRDWERLWEHGIITGRECMDRQTRLIRARPESLRLVAACLSIDSGIYELEKVCARTGSSLVIVGDGMDILMEAVLRARGLGHLPHYSNKLLWQNDRSLYLMFPFADPDCQGGCGVCKCKLLGETSQGAPAVYIGNGLSDCCVAWRAERLFAKGRLREYCLKQSISHEGFATLSDVTRALFDTVGVEEPRKTRVSGSRKK